MCAHQGAEISSYHHFTSYRTIFSCGPLPLRPFFQIFTYYPLCLPVYCPPRVGFDDETHRRSTTMAVNLLLSACSSWLPQESALEGKPSLSTAATAGASSTIWRMLALRSLPPQN